MHQFILKGDICFSRDQNTIAAVPGGYVVCDQGVCRGVFDALPEQFAHFPLIDHSGKLIIPGLVDLHIHAPQYAFRGTGMDLELMDWLQNITFPFESQYADPDFARTSYGIFARQLRKSATTRACIFATRHTSATQLLMDEMEDTGLISFVGRVNMDRDAPAALLDESAEASLTETEKWLRACGAYRRTKPILTPRFIPCCTEALLSGLGRLKQTYRLPVQSHLSENPGEIAAVMDLCPGISCYAQGYDRHGLLSPAIMAHCVHSTPEECALLRERGTYIAHCPASNMNLASGIAPVRKYLEMGLSVGLGTDVAGGESESLFRAMVQAVQVSKLYWRHVDKTAKPLTFAQVFYMATMGGGRFFGSVGTFAPGYEFDAVVLSDAHLPCPQSLTLHQRLERFAYLSGDLTGIVEKYAAGAPIDLT